MGGLIGEGKINYCPKEGSDEGRIEFPIAALANPLEGTFDLSCCNDASRYFRISTGYRESKKAENGRQLQIWLVPRFLIERNLVGDTAHFRLIMENWKGDAPVGLFWRWGALAHSKVYDYLTTQTLDQLSDNNLYEKWWTRNTPRSQVGIDRAIQRESRLSHSRSFRVYFGELGYKPGAFSGLGECFAKCVRTDRSVGSTFKKGLTDEDGTRKNLF